MSEKKSRGSRPTFTDQEALQFHSSGRPGKLEVVATKPMATQRDLSLAYSPGVAVPVLAIAEDATRAYDYTVKGNFVAAERMSLSDYITFEAERHERVFLTEDTKEAFRAFVEKRPPAFQGR